MHKKLKLAQSLTAGFGGSEACSMGVAVARVDCCGRMGGQDFGDRPKQLIAAFAALDTKKTGKVKTELVVKLLTAFELKMSADEVAEFQQEADDGGFIVYDHFVNKIIFGESR